MRVGIRSQSEATRDQRSSIERRLRFVLARFGNRISRVTVSLAALKSAQPDLDNRCRIVVSLRRAAPVIVEVTDPNLDIAIRCALQRIGPAVGREIMRRSN